MRVKYKEDEFVNKITFDLMNPSISQANALLTFLSFSADKIDTEEKNMLELTLNYCYKMQNLIKTYEMINKLDVIKSEMKYESVDLYEITRAFIKDYKIVYKYNNLKTKYSNKEPFIVYGDCDMIEKAVEIIIMEAIYTARKDSIIEVEFLKNKREIQYLVKNKSIYMEFQKIEENKKRINFHEKNYAPGYYLAKECILAHYGRMITEHYPDKTHIYGFALPIK